jgi:hypothetical protein
MRQELAENLDANGTPPQCSKQGTKNDHSPWSAPRERKRRNKPVEVALTSIEEIEYATSPPKRHNGEGRGPGVTPLPLLSGLKAAIAAPPVAACSSLALALVTPAHRLRACRRLQSRGPRPWAPRGASGLALCCGQGTCSGGGRGALGTGVVPPRLLSFVSFRAHVWPRKPCLSIP